MRQLLVLNPNTSASVSALLQRHVQAAAGLHVAVRTATARFGAPYIACEASYAVAAHAALDAWANELSQHQPQPDAVLIGCFGDPGLMALRIYTTLENQLQLCPLLSKTLGECAVHGLGLAGQAAHSLGNQPGQRDTENHPSVACPGNFAIVVRPRAEQVHVGPDDQDEYVTRKHHPKGAEILLVPNGSPYRRTADRERTEIARARVAAAEAAQSTGWVTSARL